MMIEPRTGYTRGVSDGLHDVCHRGIATAIRNAINDYSHDNGEDWRGYADIVIDAFDDLTTIHS
jgi:hypothetical protein